MASGLARLQNGPAQSLKLFCFLKKAICQGAFSTKCRAPLLIASWTCSFTEFSFSGQITGDSHQLILALTLLVGGLLVAGFSGQADLVDSAPRLAERVPMDAPPIWPFLFITIACGAISGFHCLVSSGTSSKQLASEGDALYVGYGAMLLEGATLDYKDGLEESGFAINNPNAQRTCGCGQSFS